MKKVCLDTNLLMNDIDLEQFEVVYLPSITLEEIDKHKESSDNERAFKARRASRKIKNSNNIEFISEYHNNMPIWLDLKKNDNMILAITKELQLTEKDVVFLTGDLNLYFKAKALGLNCDWYDCGMQGIDEYKGWKEITGDTTAINNLFDDINNGKNSLNFVINEYLILNNTDLNNVTEHRFDGKGFVDLKLPPSKVIKGLNSHQRCALDLLNNKDIGIKTLLGTYGSGKTYLALRMALYHVQEKDTFSKILAVREPVSEGQDVGYLKGTFTEKTEHFFRPLEQSLKGGEMELQNLMNYGVLENNIPRNLKGTTFNETWIIVDEAEDLSEKQIKTIGTRLGKNSVISFCGDYKQAVKNATLNNPLIKMCRELKGDADFGCIVLPEDVRSELSKKFANLFE